MACSQVDMVGRASEVYTQLPKDQQNIWVCREVIEDNKKVDGKWCVFEGDPRVDKHARLCLYYHEDLRHESSAFIRRRFEIAWHAFLANTEQSVLVSKDPFPRKLSTPKQPSFEKQACTNGYQYVLHLKTNLGKWVPLIELRAKSIEEAYFDADPTFCPSGNEDSFDPPF